MSYSRWGNSRWYTYWLDTNTHFKIPTRRLKRSQIFKIHDDPIYGISYGELEDKGMGVVWDEIRKFYYTSYDGKAAKKPSETEMRELMNYISEWRRDVDDHFKLLKFIKHEWYIPIRNKIFRTWKNTKN